MENPCSLGAPQTAQCYYVVNITTPKYVKGRIGGKISKLACDQNKDSGNPGEDCTDFLATRQERFFPVKGSPALNPNADYEFFSQVTDPPTEELVCVDQRGHVTSTCMPRTTALPIVP